MKKMNNKGFVLVETLIVTVFVVAIFSIVFMNFYPLIGEYERRENYDDVDSKYGVYWVKKMLQDSNIYDFKEGCTGSCTPLGHKYNSFNILECEDMFSESDSKYNICKNLWSDLGINKAILTKYNIETLKECSSSSSDSVCVTQFKDFSENFKDYISYLPKYTYPSLNGADYRVLVEFRRNADGEDYYTYATMEVIK